MAQSRPLVTAGFIYAYTATQSLTDACIQDTKRRLDVMMARLEHKTKLMKVSSAIHTIHACRQLRLT